MFVLHTFVLSVVRVFDMLENRWHCPTVNKQRFIDFHETLTDILFSPLAFVAVAKGSMNSVGRKQRRRIGRPPSRRQQVSSSVVSTSTSVSTSSATAEREAKQAEQNERMELDSDYKETSLQILRTHSSSGSSSDNSTGYSNCNNNNKNNSNIKTVLQPTMVNTNSSKISCNGNNGAGNNKTSAVKLCDDNDQEQEPERAMEEDDFEEEDELGDGDSGYEFALEPNSQSLHISTQQHQSQTTHDEGLLSIALKTIKLVQRNKLLQKRLAQLQLETSEFIASVLANPENRHFREKIAAKSDPAPNKVSNVLLRH